MSVRPGSYGCARWQGCPCGSGRKYKRCCLGEEERLARDARLENDVGRAIADWSAATYADELADAFEEFHPESRGVDEGAFAQFLAWFNSDRELSDGRTPVERYAARPDLDPVEREVAVRIAAARLGLHRVRSVAPGQSIKLENVLTGTSIRVASQSVSRELVRWDVILCRVMPGEPLPPLEGLDAVPYLTNRTVFDLAGAAAAAAWEAARSGSSSRRHSSDSAAASRSWSSSIACSRTTSPKPAGSSNTR